MLPTPPYDAYPTTSYRHGSLPTMQSLNYTVPACRYEIAGYDDYGYSSQYSQPAAGAAIPRAAYHSESHNYASQTKVVPIQSSSKGYSFTNLPVLPPIRAADRSMDDYQQRARSARAPTVTQPQPKEEKIGGVAAHLDYKMDEMVDFVSEMAQAMYGIYASKICLADIDMTRSVMNSNISVNPDFRRYVSQVLTSTRLPSSTILLGLHYLTARMTMLSARGKYTYGGGDVYNMLTTALLLGSKFLDDNTFQNRSWSDVSNIPVHKLNLFESEWLQDINWEMHFDPLDPKGFALWQRRWQTYQVATPSKKVDSLVETMSRTSIDGGFQRQPTAFQPASATPRYGSQYSEGNTPVHYSKRTNPLWHDACYDQWTSAACRSEYSPPSAPETEPNTPDYAMPNGFGYGQLPSIHPSLKMPVPLQILPSNAPSHGYPTPNPTPQYNQYAGHGSYCPCSYCMSHTERYSMNYAYGQAVA